MKKTRSKKSRDTVPLNGAVKVSADEAGGQEIRKKLRTKFKYDLPCTYSRIL
jgi:hypothetical protein